MSTQDAGFLFRAHAMFRGGENIYATKAIWVGLDSMGIEKKRGML